MNAIASLNRAPLSQQISEDLRGRLLAGYCRDSGKLPPEARLAEMYEVSRPTIREALKRLSALGLVHTKRGVNGGAFITQFGPGEAERQFTITMQSAMMSGRIGPHELVGAAFGLFFGAVHLIVHQNLAFDPDPLQQHLLKQTDPRSDKTAFFDAFWQFGGALTAACQNPVIDLQWQSLNYMLSKASVQFPDRLTMRANLVAQQSTLLQALQEKSLTACANTLNVMMHSIQELTETAA